MRNARCADGRPGARIVVEPGSQFCHGRPPSRPFGQELNHQEPRIRRDRPAQSVDAAGCRPTQQISRNQIDGLAVAPLSCQIPDNLLHGSRTPGRFGRISSRRAPDRRVAHSRRRRRRCARWPSRPCRRRRAAGRLREHRPSDSRRAVGRRFASAIATARAPRGAVRDARRSAPPRVAAAWLATASFMNHNTDADGTTTAMTSNATSGTLRRSTARAAGRRWAISAQGMIVEFRSASNCGFRRASCPAGTAEKKKVWVFSV